MSSREIQFFFFFFIIIVFSFSFYLASISLISCNCVQYYSFHIWLRFLTINQLKSILIKINLILKVFFIFDHFAIHVLLHVISFTNHRQKKKRYNRKFYLKMHNKDRQNNQLLYFTALFSIVFCSYFLFLLILAKLKKIGKYNRKKERYK